MPPDRREILVLAGVGLAAAVAGAVLGPFASQSRSGASALLSTVFPDIAGQPRRLRDWSGKVAVCNFWATWCVPCREEIPLLIALYGKHRDLGLDIVGIGVDKLPNIAEFAANLKITYPLLIGDARALDLMRSLGNDAGALPYTVVLDRQGTVAYRKLGAFKSGELDAIVAPLLR
jgi:thiol-disulfide isomerase/thioredoxin